MKSKIPLITGVCVAAAIALCAAPNIPAQGKKSPAPEAAASASSMATETSGKPARAIPYRGKVASVDAAAKTFTIAGKTGSRVFKITDQTQIMKQGAPATMADIVADEEMRGSYWKKSDGSLEAKKVNLGPNTDAAETRKRSKKEKSADSEAAPTATP
ncbi:MAG: hypothetical protein H0X34_00325 [Chthoniobacterales bacterium]|nr:hypothetical protein [Chthoniobacterales bacterium]